MGAPVEVNLENERFTVVCSCRRYNIKFRNFIRQTIGLKCVQLDYFSSFNQSFYCFLALSLLTLQNDVKSRNLKTCGTGRQRMMLKLYYSL